MKTLYIFDFDGTLFKSPEPNPSLWNTASIGRIKSMPEEGCGFGWFQDTITLDDPYVPLIPETDIWFNKNVLNDALNALKDENNVVCLLTGRTLLYKDIIDRILKSVNLNFHHKGLKPINLPNVVRESTFDFKKKFILDLIHSTYKNEITKVIVYEDRINHVDLFNSFLSTIKVIEKFNVVHVNEDPKYLSHQDELKLVDYLVSKNSSTKPELKKNVDYTGLVLNKESVDKILSLVEIPNGWFLKAHHVTLNLGNINHKLWKPIDSGGGVVTVGNGGSEIIETFQNLSISAITVEQQVDESTTTTSTTATTESSSTTTTIVTKNNDHTEEFEKKYTVGSNWSVKIEAIGFSSNALAVKVHGVPTANTIPHCTIAIHPNAKASDSNNIRNWYPIDSLKKGEKITLSSLDERELLVYKDLIEKQDSVKVDSPSKGSGKKSSSSSSSAPKSPCTCSVTIPIDINETNGLVLSGEITEIGKLSYDMPKKGTPQKNKIAPYPIIQKLFPDASKKEILNFVPEVQGWLTKSGTTEMNLIEDYIKKNFNTN